MVHALFLRIENQILYLCRFERFENIFLRIGAPANDVDLFVVQLAHDVFHARAAHADARADWIDFRVVAEHCDLGAITGFARNAANLDRAVGDLAYLELEQSPNEIRMAARDDDLRAANAVLDRDDVRAEPIADVVVLDHDSLALRHDGFKFPKIENDIGAIEAPDRAADDFARAILELLVDHLLLDLADALHHRLLRGLRGDASEIFRRHFDFDSFADVARPL